LWQQVEQRCRRVPTPTQRRTVLCHHVPRPLPSTSHVAPAPSSRTSMPTSTLPCLSTGPNHASRALTAQPCSPRCRPCSSQPASWMPFLRLIHAYNSFQDDMVELEREPDHHSPSRRRAPRLRSQVAAQSWQEHWLPRGLY